MSARQHAPGRLWCLGVLILSAAVSMSMNSVHAWTATGLPKPLAIMYGVGPVALASMQSHAVALRALRKEEVGTFRKVLTFGLVIGGLGLSFMGIYDLLQAAVPDPFSATRVHEPAMLFPIVVDLMALASLHELLRESPVFAPASVPCEVEHDGIPRPGEVEHDDLYPLYLAARDAFGAEVSLGLKPSVRRIKTALKVGTDRARRIQKDLISNAAPELQQARLIAEVQT